MKKLIIIAIAILISATAYAGDKYLGNFNDNKYDPNSISNPYGQHGSKYSHNSINNPYSQYGSKYSNKSAHNPYANKPPIIYTPKGRQPITINPYKYNAVNPYNRPKQQTYKIYGQ